MNRITVLLSVTLAVVLYSPAPQAQTPAATVPSSPADPSITAGDSTVPNAQVDDGPEAANTTRIVRLSQTNGKVEMDRDTSLGFETAFNNLPITQGARLKTGEGSAEVEFEDGTTLRLIPDTQVDFTQLSRSAAGATLSGMNVLRGTVYVSLGKTKGNAFQLTSGDGIIKPRPGAHLRLEVKDSESRLSIISGEADFTNTSGSQEVSKRKSLIFNTATHAPADQIAGIEDAPFDAWDERQTEYHKRYSHGNALAGSGYAYGLADLNYYGSFSNVDGCGRVWRPYFASAAWDPYASGIWAWYPVSGYSWVSPYPWGWAPFHYGSWLQCGGGWGWQAGGSWSGLGHVRDPHWVDNGHRHPQGPPRVHPFPPSPRPVQGKVGSLIAVNGTPLTFSHVDRATGSFNFRNDSAGLGVPRGAFSKLGKLSETAGKAGASSVPLFFTPLNRTDSLAVGSGGLAARDDRAPQARTGDHGGFFNRPGNQNPNAHDTYTGRNGNQSNAPAGSPGTMAGYASSNHPQGDRGNSSYTVSPRGGNEGASAYRGSSSANNGAPRSGGNGGGYVGSGGGGSHAPAPAPSSPPPSASAPASPPAAAHR